MDKISGLGKLDRQRLSEIIRKTKGTISVADSASILKISKSDAAKMLSRWAKKGWLSRVKRSIYIPLQIETRSTDAPIEDAWVITQRLYALCYIGGWSAAEYWGLTEQIFQTIVVMTTQKPRKRNPIIKGIKILLKTIPEKAMFGMSYVWKGQSKISVSDPSRTMIDMLNNPVLGGGIRSTSDMLTNYLKSEKKNMALLFEYAKKMDNGAIFKRLGFLLEYFNPEEKSTIDLCKSQITKGNVKLDPTLSADNLITRWKLWIPGSWVKVKKTTGEQK